ncbi:glycoside hydrolase family 31 protein [Serpula lacrymans var. lacrymans S7.3]|uniref:beta-glucosidase n=2 Tax=Serpula lacrymans var. lacrymans TaxID=341189 RepID=F8Q5H5_SERL3|nr:glycoside hydrolase family 31 protein [Serpula lacrymans var. lacrymans S7.9]EGN96446.1 glycoside hydrolase family 31 protein [Serpula lacrymans var. lacrymans S7.3]EGO21994.1 glycoside hydrolase family 31 protein [Serpula lacrymans var. lacrymans S7.9]
MVALKLLGLVLAAASTVYAEWVDPSVLDACPGYNVTNVKTQGASLTADLVLAGTGCNVFGSDISKLALEVTYETESRIHMKITDPSTQRYEVPENVLPRPNATGSVSPDKTAIQFNYTASPFSFTISRTTTGEVLFSTGSHPLIFEPQYLRLKTDLPTNANIYGLGEHTDPFRLPTYNTTRTLWSRDAYGVPTDTNLYGNHPIYFEHRTTGTHGVFLLNSDGMDIKINDTEAGGNTTLEYNVIGGVFDLYFLAGSETDPTEVAKQYAQVVGTPAEVPYWSFGLHQCRFGYTDYIDVANVILNYSTAEIPLETMWTDIDYMYKRRIFTTDPDYFPVERMREIVDYLHSHDQRYVLMTDPAVAYLPDDGYGAYDRGSEMDIWVKSANGSNSLGLVWPGVTVFPDWFNSDTQSYWSKEFQMFYSPETGIDIDGAWIDMNEPSSFCVYPCEDPFAQAITQGLPPNRTDPIPNPDTPIFGNSTYKGWRKRDEDSGFNIVNPPYNIENAAGALGSLTANVTSVAANGLLMYDTHNLYGTMMSMATRNAMLARRPGERTLVITRSTFAGAGAHVGKWLGDNMSLWPEYQFSIAGMLGMATVYQIPMVGSDICGYGDNTTETLCARWAMLGAFYPFMRNHNTDGTISQEFYRWPTVAEAARNVLDIRYRFMDYMYTAFHTASVDGTPVVSPVWFAYPEDPNTFSIEHEFFYGSHLLVSPVLEENSTSVTFYLPNDTFYDLSTLAPVMGQGANVTLNNVSFTEIPLHIRGGVVLPLRASGAMTTTILRDTDFEIVVAPSPQGAASGQLYVDDGLSITPDKMTEVTMAYSNGSLVVNGTFDYQIGVDVRDVVFLGVANTPKNVTVESSGKTKAVAQDKWTYEASTQVLNVTLALPFEHDFSVSFS